MTGDGSRKRMHHIPFYVAAACGGVALAANYLAMPQICPEYPALAFFVAYLLATAAKVRNLSAQDLHRHAADTDEPVAIIFLVTLGAVCFSVSLLFLLLNSGPSIPTERLGLSLAAVGLGWFTIHTMAAMHYAHIYWLARKSSVKPGHSPDVKAAGGLDFPGTTAPGVADFLYFSFVIGMTAQTSDVAITTTPMRRLNLAHAVVSYFFNTVLVAAAVNIAVTLAG